MRSIGRLLGIGLVCAAASSLAACATGGEAGTSAEAEAEVRQFDNWGAVFRHYVPRARVRGGCVANIGRGGSDSPPVIEIDGQRRFDGCPPSGYEPEEIVRVEVLNSSEAGMVLGSRGSGGMIRMYTR